VSLNRHDKRCPQCGSADLEERGRVEGGFGNSGGCDTAIIECQQCRNIWDTEMPYDVPHETCGARTVFWPDDEACDAQCIRHHGHSGTIHEDEILGEWNEEDLYTTAPETGRG
jgi:hypothetical protein